MRSFLHVIVAVGLIASSTSVFAGDAPKGKSDCGGGCIVRCPNCCHECIFSVDKEAVTKSCYRVECKDICIPRVVFPWQKGCGPCSKGGKDGKDGCDGTNNGAKTKSVRVLKKFEYQCSECKYKWTPDSKKGDKDKELAPEPAEAPAPPPVEARSIFGRKVVERVARAD